MEAQDPLSQLADIRLPEEVSFWPPAIGWWLLAALLLAVLVFAVRWLRATLWQRRRLAAALAELEACRERYQQSADKDPGRAGLAYLSDLNAVLRRVALLHHPEHEVAGLSGERWLAFLDAHISGRPFREGPGKALGEAQYRPAFHGDPEPLHALAERWIREQYRQARGSRLLPRREARA